MYITAEGYKMVDSKADLIEFVMKQSRNKFYDTFDSLVELRPLHESHISFNKRAWVAVSMSRVVLISYNTIVCEIRYDRDRMKFIRYWSGWSATTGRHILEFSRQYYFEEIRKKQWNNFEINEWEG